jgi:molybdopterin molybdotransferase
MSVPSPLLPVADALARIIETAQPLASERVSLPDALGRTLSQDVTAKRTQPPFAASSMDGYAVRAADLAQVPVTLRVIGTSSAGHRFHGEVMSGDCVRIFTGAPLPDGADSIIIQENTTAQADRVEILQSEPKGSYVRPAGLDFQQGDVLLKKGTRLGPCELAIAAAMNHGSLAVTRKPRIAILATGDELVQPGQEPGPDQIVASNTFAVGAYARQAGADIIDLGIAGDTFADIERCIRAAHKAKADVLVTLGGASVGDHDLVQSALTREGMELGFWKIAMRPGKPLMHGQLGSMQILGLPGNPVSAIVCGVLFLVPLVRALSGDPHAGTDRSEAAILGGDLKENDSREDYLRAELSSGSGLPIATPFSRQDSSMLRVLAQSHCLVIRPPRAPAAKAGEPCRIIRLGSF